MVRCHKIGGNAVTKRELLGPRASSILVSGSANLLAFHMTLHVLLHSSHSELLSFIQMCHTFFFFFKPVGFQAASCIWNIQPHHPLHSCFSLAFTPPP